MGFFSQIPIKFFSLGLILKSRQPLKLCKNEQVTIYSGLVNLKNSHAYPFNRRLYLSKAIFLSSNTIFKSSLFLPQFLVLALSEKQQTLQLIKQDNQHMLILLCLYLGSY